MSSPRSGRKRKAPGSRSIKRLEPAERATAVGYPERSRPRRGFQYVFGFVILGLAPQALRFRPLRGLGPCCRPLRGLEQLCSRSWGWRPGLYAAVRFADSAHAASRFADREGISEVLMEEFGAGFEEVVGGDDAD